MRNLIKTRTRYNTGFPIGGIRRRDLGGNSSGTNEDGESQPARDEATIVFLDRLLLLGSANEVGGLGDQGLAVGGGGGSSRRRGGEGGVVQETLGRCHLCSESLSLSAWSAVCECVWGWLWSLKIGWGSGRAMWQWNCGWWILGSGWAGGFGSDFWSCGIRRLRLSLVPRGTPTRISPLVNSSRQIGDTSEIGFASFYYRG